jgi:hypothetical protein
MNRLIGCREICEIIAYSLINLLTYSLINGLSTLFALYPKIIRV